MRYVTTCWLLEEGGDWNPWRRMAALGALVAFLDRLVLLHTAVAPDVLRTDIAWHLDIEFASAAMRSPA